jgi:uncharacterized RDD family membrane protein YckC
MDAQIQLYRAINGFILFLLIAYIIYAGIKIKKRNTVFNSEGLVAGFRLRVFSAVVDFVVLALFFFLLLMLLGPIAEKIPQPLETIGELCIVWIYYSGLHASKLQATIGKMIIGLRVVDSSGKRITLLRSSERFLGSIISQLFLYFGYIMIAFTKHKQGFHDVATDTFVVKRASIKTERS